MARIRTVKPEIFDDERLGQLDPLAFIACVWAVTEADDAGRLRWNPAHVRAGAWRYRDVTLAQSAALMAEVEAARFVVRYEDDGQAYAVIRTWFTHQVLDASKVRPKAPWCPRPPLSIVAECKPYLPGVRELLARVPESRHDALADLLLPREETENERGAKVGPTWDERGALTGTGTGTGTGTSSVHPSGGSADTSAGPSAPPTPYADIVAAWNEIAAPAGAVGKRTVPKSGTAIAKAIRARHREHDCDLAWWRQAFAAVAADDWSCGRTDRGTYRISLEDACRPGRLDKLIDKAEAVPAPSSAPVRSRITPAQEWQQ